jgi:phospholipid N-methyltransferase
MTRAASLFFSQFWRSPTTIGAALPSSRRLAAAMVAPIDFATARLVVEFGPGTGPFTRAIAERLGPGCRYLGIELNPVFAQRLAHEFPSLDFACGSAADLGRLLRERGLGAVDAIVCGLPWASLPPAVQHSVFREITHHLTPGGVFVTFAYLQGLVLPGARTLRRRLAAEFSRVTTTPVVWRNFPPAFAYVCKR